MSATLTISGGSVAKPKSQVMVFIGFISMVFGMFMAILDIQIVSASLSDIQAGLSASADEISWVQTSYLIAEVIMIPLSGTLSRILSTRYLFCLSVAGFTIMSFLCAQATSIEAMIVFRALQGFIGGAMIPTVFATSFTIFPPQKQAIISPIIGLVATLAPTIGPTIGGYLTDILSWHWLFLINIIPGIFVTISVYFLVDHDKPEPSVIKQFDWMGLAVMAVMLGSLEYLLEEGPGDDWFDSSKITTLAAVFTAAMLAFIWRVRVAKLPIVDFSALRNRNFSTGSLLSFVMGIGLYGLTYLYPVFLSRVRGFTALEIGETMFITGIAMFVMAPVSGRLMMKVDPRIMMAVGFTGFALGTWQAHYVTKDWGFYELLVPQILRGASLMLAMVPITTLSLGTLPIHQLRQASGLFNLTRNLGGAVGLAVINTLLTNRTDFHDSRLRESITADNTAAQDMISGLEKTFSGMGPLAHDAALLKLAQTIKRSAMVMAINDVFLLLTVLFACVVITMPFLRKPAKPGGGSGGH